MAFAFKPSCKGITLGSWGTHSCCFLSSKTFEACSNRSGNFWSGFRSLAGGFERSAGYCQCHSHNVLCVSSPMGLNYLCFGTCFRQVTMLHQSSWAHKLLTMMDIPHMNLCICVVCTHQVLVESLICRFKGYCCVFHTCGKPFVLKVVCVLSLLNNFIIHPFF